MPHTTSRGRTFLFVVAIIIIALGLISTGTQIYNAGTLRAQRRSDDIAGCRGAFRLVLIDAPTFAALKANARGDDAATKAAIEEGNPDEYKRLVLLSNSNPSAFLRACHRLKP